MATSRSKPNSPLQSTRQMLDELDALMDRMLALPVGDAEDLPPLPREVPASAISATLTESTLTEDEEITGQESGVRSQESGVRGPGSRKQRAGIRNQAPADERDLEDAETPLAERLAPRVVRTDLPKVNNGAVQGGPHLPPHKWHEEDIQDAVNKFEEAKKKLVVETAPQVPDEKSASTTAAPAVDTIVRPAVPPASTLPLLPLIWLNNAFDIGSLLLGPLGLGLRGARGRGFLGVVGVLCLVLAGAWFIFDQISAR